MRLPIATEPFPLAVVLTPNATEKDLSVIDVSAQSALPEAASLAPPVDVAPAPGQAGTAAYLASSDRVATLMGVGWKLCLLAMALVALAWVLGLLPAAARLF